MVNLRNYLKSVTPAYWDAKEKAADGAFWRESQTYSARYMSEISFVAALPDKRCSRLSPIGAFLESFQRKG